MALWSDRSFLREVQCQSDAKLAARQPVWECLVRAVTSRLPGGSGAPPLGTSHSGCLACA
jgi:hypothetical protein